MGTNRKTLRRTITNLPVKGKIRWVDLPLARGKVTVIHYLVIDPEGSGIRLAFSGAQLGLDQNRNHVDASYRTVDCLDSVDPKSRASYVIAQAVQLPAGTNLKEHGVLVAEHFQARFEASIEPWFVPPFTEQSEIDFYRRTQNEI